MFLVAAHTAIETGGVSEWVGFEDADAARQGIAGLASRYLTKLYETTGTQN
jgi:hypothetical protein